MCKDCNKRHLGCHSNCMEYAEYKRKLEETKQIKRKLNDFISYKQDRYREEYKRRG